MFINRYFYELSIIVNWLMIATVLQRQVVMTIWSSIFLTILLHLFSLEGVKYLRDINKLNERTFTHDVFNIKTRNNVLTLIFFKFFHKNVWKLVLNFELLKTMITLVNFIFFVEQNMNCYFILFFFVTFKTIKIYYMYKLINFTSNFSWQYH